MLVEPAIETFRTNKTTLGIVSIVSVFVAGIFLGQIIEPGAGNFRLTIAFIVFGLVGFWIVWLISVRVSLHENGIAYRSLFSAKAILWADIDRFYYRAYKQSINFIPVGTWYSFKLINAENGRISFGNRIERPEEVGNRLIEATYPLIFRKAVERFEQGLDVNFGLVRLSRSNGISIETLSGTVNVPLDSVANYRIEQGSFLVWHVGQKRTRIAIWKIPNVFVLVGLLDDFYRRRHDSNS